MASEPIVIQREWDFRALHDAWPSGMDNKYILKRLGTVPVEITAKGAHGPVLEVAAAEAIHSCKLALRGLRTVVLEPSPAMLERARERMAEFGAQIELVRGIAETLPFADGTFDRVLIESAIDHLADPALGVREMTRVLAPEGRLLIGFVNYGSPNVRLSRLYYGIARALGRAWSRQHLFWDSPVPAEHTFECTFTRIRRLCGPHLELDQAHGVSIGWAFPGWGEWLSRQPEHRAYRIVH
ncbi:MAG TPA: class I SAM-dependent methyltransferase, partial [Candidatus Binatia bacterium]|nr:class I SAM-dependent methyltransferase [Candidatus Binatia bacterium]